MTSLLLLVVKKDVAIKQNSSGCPVTVISNSKLILL